MFAVLITAFLAMFMSGHWHRKYTDECKASAGWKLLALAAGRGDITNSMHGTNVTWHHTSPDWYVSDTNLGARPSLSQHEFGLPLTVAISHGTNKIPATQPTNRLYDVYFNGVDTNSQWFGKDGSYFSGFDPRAPFRLTKSLDMVADLQGEGIGNKTNSHVYIFTDRWNAEVYFMESNLNLFPMVATTNPVTVRGISK